MITLLICSTCTDKVPNWVILMLGIIILVILFVLIFWKIILKIKEVRRKRNASF